MWDYIWYMVQKLAKRRVPFLNVEELCLATWTSIILDIICGGEILNILSRRNINFKTVAVLNPVKLNDISYNLILMRSGVVPPSHPNIDLLPAKNYPGENCAPASRCIFSKKQLITRHIKTQNHLQLQDSTFQEM